MMVIWGGGGAKRRGLQERRSCVHESPLLRSSLLSLMILQENGDLCCVVDHTAPSMSSAAPTVIYATVDKGCSLFVSPARPYFSVAIQRLCKGTMNFCHYLLSPAGCIVKNMAALYFQFLGESLYPWKILGGDYLFVVHGRLLGGLRAGWSWIVFRWA